MSPKGLTFVRCAVGVCTTSLAVRSVALWVKGTLIGSFVYSHLMALLLPLFSSLFSSVGRSASFVITLFINICLFLVSVVSVLCDEWN